MSDSLTGALAMVGTGKHPVMVLHGWLGDATSWRSVWPYLDTSRFTYGFLDCRGYGRRINEGGDYTMAEVAADMLTCADHLQWDSFSLVGHSMGGLAMQAVLAVAPERILGMVGVAPVPASGAQFEPAVLSRFDRATWDLETRRRIIDFSTGNRHTHVWLDIMQRHSSVSTRPEVLSAYLQSWSTSDLVESIRGMSLPVGVIIGDQDPTYSLERMNETWGRWYPNHKIMSIPGAGHYPMAETPVSLAGSIEQMLPQ